MNIKASYFEKIIAILPWFKIYAHAIEVSHVNEKFC